VCVCVCEGGNDDVWWSRAKGGAQRQRTYEKHDVMTKLLLLLLLLLPWYCGCLSVVRKGGCVSSGPVPYKEQTQFRPSSSVTQPHTARTSFTSLNARDDGEVDGARLLLLLLVTRPVVLCGWSGWGT